jgi:F420-dependent oxidoreductase-like protein
MKLALNTMKWGVNYGFWGPGVDGTTKMVKHAESLGYDSVWTSEASGTDSVSPLGFLAGQTSKIKLGANIMQMAGRTPATTAMTAVTMDALTNGRFILGLGASGPAVVEGWHNQRYGKPVARSREYIAIVREIIARQRPVEFHGEYFDMPYQGEGATGLARPIKLMVRPRRPRLPLYLAAMGPKNLRLALETCDGILPVAWSPSRDAAFLGDHNAPAARAEIATIRQERGLGPLEIAPFVPVLMNEKVAVCHDQMRPVVAFWLGAMGPKTMNFYNRLALRFGYEEAAERIPTLYAEGRRTEAARLVPDALIDEIGLYGPAERIRDQFEAWKESSVTTMIICGATRRVVDLMAQLAL